jgi:hypothetical protein
MSSLWQNLVHIKDQIGKVPLLLAEDFNVVKSMQETWDCDKLSSYETRVWGVFKSD